jgi:flagellin-like hook-associated protein FlgL
MENLHKQEQQLLKKLTQTKSEEQREAIKRTIVRINEEMKEIDN